ncbi:MULTISPECIES: hydroxymethylbilane synthase [Methanobacterium]|uniref:Probable porphobilinogen deaminase n=1 Tax=Methanobacterium veterum TaxID=408577 RepID=A0A9E5DMH5_9EURY|nr:MULTISPECIES: hydroxymethylbilane synthase [Methanobacterium]MCZ3366700.1 hydroxymethylbilane synthase [Methanobacterium veterum]MCZ3374155.1 hydroxymethylbilane synthase [Methanobacterium veterum]
MKVGTRGSNLAVTQTKSIISQLSKIINEEIDMEIIKTTGDKITDSQLYSIDVKGIFTKELDKAVLEEDVDFAVHSLKDLPTELAGDLEIVAVPERESPNDVLISSHKWDELPEGASIGTSSLRREAFCNYHGKKLNIKPIRGNIDTRIKKVISGEYDATIMAEAGLNRLGLAHHIKEVFPVDYFTPAAGQGALAVVARHDSSVRKTLEKLNHFNSVQEIAAEKAVLAELGVGCQWPLGVSAKANGNKLDVYSILLTKEGDVLSEAKLSGSINDAEKLGKDVAKIMEDYV